MRNRKSTNPKYDPLKHKSYMLKSQYGITLIEKEIIVEKQKGKCAICKKHKSDILEKDLYPDHDHETGLLREMLCNKCNIGLGSFLDSTKLIKKAMNYLKKSNKKEAV